jgi:hypothetical protein
MGYVGGGMKSNQEIINQFYGKSGHKAYSEKGLNLQKEEDEINLGFFHGDEMSYKAELSNESRRFAVCFNRVQPVINFYVGFAAQNRRNTDFNSLSVDDEIRQSLTEIINKSSAWIRSNANADQVETQQDISVAVCGYGAVTKAIDYTKNPDGEVVYKEVTQDFYWDAQAKEAGLLDRRWDFIKTTMYVEDAIKFFGGSEEDYEFHYAQGSYKFDPNLGGGYDRIAYEHVNSTGNLIHVYQYNWYDLEKQWRIENPIFNEANEFIASMVLVEFENLKKLRLAEAEDDEYYNFNPRAKNIIASKDLKADLEEIVARYNIKLEYDENLTRCYYEAIISGTKVFQKRKSIDQSGFTTKIKTAFYDRKNKLWRGMVSSLREPARYANKMVTDYLFLVASTAKSGWFYDQNKVLDITAFEERVNKSAKAIGVDGDPSMVVMPKQQGVLPNGFDNLYPIFVQTVFDTVGLNREAMGMGDLSQPSFELEQQRIKQVMVTLAIYFDSITLYQKEDARSLPYYIKRLAKNKEGFPIVANNNDGVPSTVQVFSDMIEEHYAIEIGEAPDTPTRKKEQMMMINSFTDKIIMSTPHLAAKALAKQAKFLPISGRERLEYVQLLDPPLDPQAQQAQAEKAAKEDAIKEEMIATDMRKKRAETELKTAQTAKTQAEISKVEAEADKANLETIAMSTIPVNELNINI